MSVYCCSSALWLCLLIGWLWGAAAGPQLGNVIEELSTPIGSMYRTSCDRAKACLVAVDDPREDRVPFHLKSTRRFDDVMYTMADTLQFLGGFACARVMFPGSKPIKNQCLGAYRVILFGFELLHLYPVRSVPRHSLLYNLVSVGSAEWKLLSNYAIKMMHLFRVLDPSWENVRLLREQHINSTYIPIGHSDGLTIPHILNRDDNSKPIDVLLVGGCSEKHCDLARRLREGGRTAFVVSGGCGICPAVVTDTSAFKSRMEYVELLGRAKIIVNMHPGASEIGTFKLAHFTFMLANRMFVISETGFDKFAEDQVSGGVLFSGTSELLSTCEHYLQHPTERSEIASFGFDLIRQLSNAQQLRCPLFGRRIKPGYSRISKRHHSPIVSTEYRHSSLLAFSQAFVPPDCFRVVAIMASFNEADVVESSVMDLIEQGCDVHFMDNWSQDDSVIRVQQLQRRYPTRITVEMFPASGAPKAYNWGDILRRKEELANTLNADWFVHVDPDELRESPWGRSIPLRQALYIANELGYNVVNFGKLLVFRPTKGPSYEAGQPLRTSFLYFNYNSFAGDSSQVKAWKSYYSSCTVNSTRPPVAIALVKSGGHVADYASGGNLVRPRFRLFPYNFILRHYPVRSQEHGVRKIFKERKARWNETEYASLGWHRQYEKLTSASNFQVDKRTITMTYPNGDLPYNIYADSSLPCPHKFYVPHTLAAYIDDSEDSSSPED